ncbi:MAG: hypothetical protein A3F18_00915 [Legionellales bacterium RIFCSPHIGHO2_12_FULL_37_14]|nr:MAG: hypothetical protein A3F18_00915 [Legionellales bacterium RIFCSPHIGHO2_12_FULL_37_14]
MRIKRRFKKLPITSICFLATSIAFAQDKLANAMTGDVQDMLGGSGTFWKVFILVDVILASAMAVKTKNPMVFAGVFAIAFIPALLINAFVF